MKVEEKKEEKKKGFAAMTPERQREIASMGGKKAHELGVAHRYNKDTAKLAGHKGGLSVSQDREHMAAIGKKGGTVGGIKKRSLFKHSQ